MARARPMLTGSTLLCRRERMYRQLRSQRGGSRYPAERCGARRRKDCTTLSTSGGCSLGRDFTPSQESTISNIRAAAAKACTTCSLCSMPCSFSLSIYLSLSLSLYLSLLFEGLRQWRE